MFSPFCNWKFPPISNTSGLNATFWNFNNTIFIRIIIPENVFKLILYGSKAPEISEMKSIETGTKVSTIKAPLPAMGKCECITSCNCMDRSTRPISLKFCEMDVNFRLNLLFRGSLVVNVQNDTFFGLILTICTIFKICRQFSENAIFEKSSDFLQFFSWFYAYI